MHPGLVDWPFVPHNLISVQKSPVPSPRFQMDPISKILMSSGSKKGTQIFYPFLSKSPGKGISSRFPNGVPMERDTHLQGIVTSFLTYLFYLSLRVPGKGAPSMFPNGVPMERDTHLQGIFTSFLIYFFIFPSESPVREPPPCSLTGSPWTAILHHQSHWSIHSFIHSCKSAGVPKNEPS